MLGTRWPDGWLPDHRRPQGSCYCSVPGRRRLQPLRCWWRRNLRFPPPAARLLISGFMSVMESPVERPGFFAFRPPSIPALRQAFDGILSRDPCGDGSLSGSEGSGCYYEMRPLNSGRRQSKVAQVFAAVSHRLAVDVMIRWLLAGREGFVLRDRDFVRPKSRSDERRVIPTTMILQILLASYAASPQASLPNISRPFDQTGLARVTCVATSPWHGS